MEFNTTISPSLSLALQIPQSSILYQSDNVTLIDIPRSISEAQGTPTSPCHQNIISCPALSAPFPSNEPKSAAAKLKLQAKMASMATEYDEVYVDLIQKALTVIRDAYRSEWCLPRSIPSSVTNVGSKRKASEMDVSVQPDYASNNLPRGRPLQHDNDHDKEMQVTLSLPEPDPLPHLAANDPTQKGLYTLRCTTMGVAAKPDPLFWDHHLSNSAKGPVTFDVLSSKGQPTAYVIPPGSSLYLADCAASRPFHTAVRKQAQIDNTSPLFDFILMDPPWPNASVTRARDKMKSGYQTAPSVWDIRQLLFETDLDVLLAADGIIAIWITNNPAVRGLVLGEDGLFDSWGVVLEEEWLWIKTTKSGEPVTALDALWRKPYEVCLLGRKHKHSSASDGSGESHNFKRRVIAGVPDLHSRKPCLKHLIEPLMPDRLTYRALEVFARVLVAGWWSWGNEVLKFNNKQYWTDLR